MTFILDEDTGVWFSSDITGLQLEEANNFLAYRQPYAPGDIGFDPNLVTNGPAPIVKFTQHEVMFNGYGGNITQDDFSFVQRFKSGEFSSLADGRYSFQDLVDLGHAIDIQGGYSDGRISGNIYLATLKNGLGFDDFANGGSSTLNMLQEGVHGSVGFSLKPGTEFIVHNGKYYVNSEIGALDDNYDFISGSNLVNFLNPMLFYIFGPNAPVPDGQFVEIRFRGEGKKEIHFIDTVTEEGNNQYLDNDTNFSKGTTDSSTDNDDADFENGTARDGGNHSSNMPVDVINGDGWTNTVASSVVTDDYSPGRIEINETQEHMDFVRDVSLAISIVEFNAQPALPGSHINLEFHSKYASAIGGAVLLRNVDPLVLDMDGDGVELISFEDSLAFFDVDNDGVLENTGWVSADDALLVHDVSGDGVINSITETISEYYMAAPGTGAIYTDGLEALATLDSNSDGVFNANDAAYGTLRVWRDANENAVTDAGELKTLAELNITSIDLTREVASREEIEGNPVLSRSTMVIGGLTNEVAAVDFATNPIGYEWNAIAEGIQIKTEDNSVSAVFVNDIDGGIVDLSLLNSDGDTANDSDSVMGNAGDDIIIGDGGDNWLFGGGGSDIIQGGLGNDTITIDGQDDLSNIDTGAGFDTVIVTGLGGVVLNLKDINAEVALGSVGNDIIMGGGNTNVFVRSGAGDDVIIGGSADDALSGEDGNDTIDGGLGDDVLRGHRGKDLLIGNLGEDFLDGGLGDDELYGEEGEDLLRGDGGNDKLYGGAAYDVAELSGKIDEYTVTRISATEVMVKDRVEGRDGTDILTDIEALNFQDIKEVNLNIDSPFTANDILSVGGSGPYTLLASDILANDIDYQGDALHITQISEVVGGTAVLNGSGNVVFTPDLSFTGVMSFKYKIADVDGTPGTTAVLKATGQSAEVRGTVYLQETDHPSDPLFYDQWYLSDANVLPVWNDYTGKGVNIGVFEIGVADTSHPDLVDNLTQNTIDNADPADISGHATLVTGVIGAARNGIGSTGVAYESDISNFSLGETIGSGSSVLTEMKYFDIVNNSWGVSQPFIIHLADGNAYEGAAALGREGLGTVIIAAPGNDRQEGGNANAHELYNNVYTIAVAAINKEADLSSLEVQLDPYSNPGSNILISAPGSNIASTSLLLENSNGSTFGSSYDVAEGTSFAAPIVTGVAALMLEANPNLGYRDVQEILAYSARIASDQSTTWQTNGAYNWNGGGLHFSHDYGFGNVDALAAVRLAETWTKQQTFGSLVDYHVSSSSSNLTIPDNSTLTSSINVSSSSQPFIVEHAIVNIDFTHSRVGDLVFTLISPNGTEGVLLNRLGVDPGSATDTGFGGASLEFGFSSVATWGEKHYGQWTLRVKDMKTGEVGTLNSWELNLSGKYQDLNDLYIYTEEFSTLTGSSRLTLTDTLGDDTINTSSIFSDTTINLNVGSGSLIDGKTVTISSGSIIERAISGDGDDTLTGNSANNLLFGGRGSDSLSGAAGNDWLIGAWGDDALMGGSGKDRFIVRNGDIGTKTIHDFNMTDDFVVLANYKDLTSISNLNIISNGSNAEIHLPDGQVIVLQNISAAALTNNQFLFDQYFKLSDITLNVLQITGTNGVDSLPPPGLEDPTPTIIFGLAGNDTLYGNLGDDILYGGDGNDTLVGAFDLNDFGGGNDTLYGEAGNDVLWGAGADDLLYGGDGNDVLHGRQGRDTLFGGKGRDGLIGNEGDDVIHLEYGLNDVWGDNYDANPINWDGTIGRDIFVIHKWQAPVSGSIQFAAGIFFGSKDIIRDFNPADEIIDIRDVQGATSFEELTFTSAGSYNGQTLLRIGLGNGQSVDLQNINPSQLSSANFIFYENQLPEAVSDSFTTNEDTAFSFTIADLLSNDSDFEDGTPAFTKIVTGPTHGTLVNNGSGNFTFTPDEHYFGSDQIVYEVIDSNGASVTSLASISIASINDSPVAKNDNFTGTEDTVLTGNVLNNNGNGADSDPDGDVLSVVAVTGLATALGGSVNIGSAGAFTYTPAANVFGTDSFTYTLEDGNGGQSTATVQITIADAPDTFNGDASDNTLNGTAGADSFYGGAGNDLLQGGLGNDSYYFTSGHDTIIDIGGSDILYLPVGVDVSHVSFLRYTTTPQDLVNLVVHVDDGDGNPNTALGTITVYNQFLPPVPPGNTQTETLRFQPVGEAILTDMRVTTFGGALDDTILGIDYGANPDDTILGFDDADTIASGAGNDTIFGGTGSDTLLGESGGDALFGEEGDDLLEGGEGADFIFGDEDSDGSSSVAYGGADILLGGDGADWLEGNKGNDTLVGGNDSDVLFGNEDNDTLNGNAGNDYLVGGTGNDILNGGSGSDNLYSEAGADILLWDAATFSEIGAVDNVYDFDLVGGDKLDVSELLSGYDPFADAITDFIQITDSGTNSTMAVDVDGSANGTNFVNVAILYGVTGLTDETSLRANGTLIAS